MANESKFVKVECPECKSKQVVFGKAASKVKCKKCNRIILICRGGKAKIKAKVVEVLK